MNACTSVCQQEKRLLKQTLREWEDDARTHRDLYAQARRQLTKGGWTPSRKAVEEAIITYRMWQLGREGDFYWMRRALLAGWRVDHPRKPVHDKIMCRDATGVQCRCKPRRRGR